MQTRIFHENMLKYNHIISKGDLPMNRKKRTYLTAIFLAAVLPLTGILSGLPEASASTSSLSVIEHIDTANNNGLILSLIHI